jgi:hypothetical protein
LGTVITNKLRAEAHLAAINKKAIFMMQKLFPLLKIENGKLNINLFKMFIDPLFRLVGAFFGYLD